MLGAVALVGAVRRRRWGDTFAVVVLVLLGWSGGRLVPIAAVTLVPFAAVALREVGTLALPSGRAARASVAAAGAIVVATLVYVVVTPDYDLERYPVGAVDWLEQRGLVGEGARVVTHDDVGNYLEWRYGTEANAYVDDRPDAATLLQYRDLLLVEPGWQDELASIEPDVVLWRAESALSDELGEPTGWHRAAEVGDYVVFCREALRARCA